MHLTSLNPKGKTSQDSMEDKVSRSSADSLSVTDEFVVVTPNSEKAVEPSQDSLSTTSTESTGLKIVGNGNMEDLKQHLDEVLGGDQNDGKAPSDASDEEGNGWETPTNNDKLRIRSSSEPVYSANNPSHQLGSGSPTSYRQQSQDLGERILSGHVDSSKVREQGSARDEHEDEGRFDPWELRSSPKDSQSK